MGGSYCKGAKPSRSQGGPNILKSFIPGSTNPMLKKQKYERDYTALVWTNEYRKHCIRAGFKIKKLIILVLYALSISKLVKWDILQFILISWGCLRSPTFFFFFAMSQLIGPSQKKVEIMDGSIYLFI
jgi:hypothetical protein